MTKGTLEQRGSNFRYQEICNDLNDQIRKASPGEKLSSVRVLMDKYEVSQSTIDRAIGELRQQGKLQSVKGKGIYILPQNHIDKVQLSCIDVFVFGTMAKVSDSVFYRELMDYLIEATGKDRVTTRVQVLPPDMDAATFSEFLEHTNPQAVVVCNLFDVALAKCLIDRKIPYTLMSPNWPTCLENSVDIDNQAVVNAWIDHLVELGHKRIAHLHGYSKEYYLKCFDERYTFFYKRMAELGLAVDPDLVRWGGFTIEDGYKATCDLIASGKDFSAIVINDSVAGGVYSALSEHGMKVGKDVSVIGTDDLQWCVHMQPPLTSVAISRTDLAENIYGKIKAAYSGECYSWPAESISVELHVRESTQKIS